MAIELTGKPIAITGASSGIGAATALACARAGMPVAVGARRADKIDALVERIRREGGKAIGVTMDVTRREDSERLMARTIEAFGSVYGVFANAGYGEECTVSDSSEEKVRAMFETNFFGTMHTVWAALPHLMRNPAVGGRDAVRGHILVCSSCLAKLGVPYCATYTATKAAQNHFARALNLEIEERGVRCSSVHPIGTRTEFFDVMRDRSGPGGSLTPHTSSAFMQTPEYVAERIVACLRRPTPEVWTGFNGAMVRYGMGLAVMAPRLTDWAVRRMLRGIRQRSGRARSATA